MMLYHTLLIIISTKLHHIWASVSLNCYTTDYINKYVSRTNCEKKWAHNDRCAMEYMNSKLSTVFLKCASSKALCDVGTDAVINGSNTIVWRKCCCSGRFCNNYEFIQCCKTSLINDRGWIVQGCCSNGKCDSLTEASGDDSLTGCLFLIICINWFAYIF